MKVKVEYVGHVKAITKNRREEQVETSNETTVAELLTHLSREYGEQFRKAIYEPEGADVKPNYIITVNGYLLNQLKGLETRLKDNDHVTILPIVSGG